VARVRVVSLGSGSSGNALLVRAGSTTVLVDAGFGPRILASRLRQAGVAASEIGAILITHEHSDHSCGAVAFAARHRIPLVGDPRTLDAVRDQTKGPSAPLASTCERHELPVGRTTKLGDLEIRSFPTSHDAVAPCGYRLATGAWSVCFATDTGEAGVAMIEAMRGAHLLVIESNHDTDRLVKGPYPWPLKRRILSPTGHLSNQQTARALLDVLDDGPRWVRLAHLSRTNNTPDLARVQVGEQLRLAGLRHVPIHVAPPDVGPVWDSASLLEEPRQARLFAPAAASVPASR
jgi:phosphoribosyl 1,2-cyclic phosphodiesterase